jgi:epoxyqueuosine reductase
MRGGTDCERDELARLVTETIHSSLVNAGTVTEYRTPLVGFAQARDDRFLALRRFAGTQHLLPDDMLPGARSVVAFFLPFASRVVEANARDKQRVAPEWARAYVETNALIGHIGAQLVETLAQVGVRAAAEPATHNFDPVTLASRWSHKSVAVIAGLGSLGLHHMIITDAGCAGRIGSLVLDVSLPAAVSPPRERCLYFQDGSCLECVQRCPVGALGTAGTMDKQRCYQHLRENARDFVALGLADVCGKCATGPCALQAAGH